MPTRRNPDQSNDTRLLTPLLLMATILIVGILIYTYTGHALAAVG